MEHFFLVKTLHNVPKTKAFDHSQLCNSEGNCEGAKLASTPHYFL